MVARSSKLASGRRSSGAQRCLRAACVQALHACSRGSCSMQRAFGPRVAQPPAAPLHEQASNVRQKRASEQSKAKQASSKQQAGASSKQQAKQAASRKHNNDRTCRAQRASKREKASKQKRECTAKRGAQRDAARTCLSCRLFCLRAATCCNGALPAAATPVACLTHFCVAFFLLVPFPRIDASKCRRKANRSIASTLGLKGR